MPYLCPTFCWLSKNEYPKTDLIIVNLFRSGTTLAFCRMDRITERHWFKSRSAVMWLFWYPLTHFQTEKSNFEYKCNVNWMLKTNGFKSNVANIRSISWFISFNNYVPSQNNLIYYAYESRKCTFLDLKGERLVVI